MPESFDPYYTWLGIPPEEQPADHYRLLGLKRFEDNRAVISHASDQRMAHLRSFQNGPRSRESQQVLNELAKASGCLLNPRRKAMYDQNLRSSLIAEQQGQAVTPPRSSDAVDPAISIQLTPRSRTTKTPPPHSRQALKVNSSSTAWQLYAGVMVAVIIVAAVALLIAGRADRPGRSLSSKGPGSSATQSPVPPPRPSESVPVAADTGKVHETSTGPAATAEETRETPVQESSAASPAGVPPAGAPQAGTIPPATPALATLPKVVAGQPRALHFRGRDRIEIANSLGLVDLRKPFTVEMWVRFAPEELSHWLCGDLVVGPNHPEVAGGQIVGWQLFIQQTVAGKHRVAVSTREGYASDFPVVANSWHHLAVCNDTRRIMVFADGRRSATGSVDRLLDTYVASPLPLYIGSHEWLHSSQPPGLTGDLRGFRISSTCQYSEDFAPDVNLVKAADTEVLLDFATGSDRELADLSGHGRVGKITGAQWFGLETLPRLAASTTTTTPPAAAISKPATTTPAATPAADVAARQPVPAELALVQAREQLRKVFGVELDQAKEPRQYLELAERLASLASESQEEPASRYVMLEEASKLASQGGDLRRALTLIQELGRRFKVEAAAQQATAVTTAAEAVRSNVDRRRVAETALDVANDLTVAGRFDLASDVIQTAIAQAARAKEVDLSKKAREYRDEIQQVKRAFAEAQVTRDKLVADPDNRELNMRWGRFVCFRQRNWELGLPYLAKGGDDSLAAAARLDRAQPADPAQQSELGRAWLDAASAVETQEKAAVLLRGVEWLRKAESQLKGLAKADVEKRIKDVESLLPTRLRSGVASSRSGVPPLQPPPEFVGLLGRVINNLADTGVLWRYDPSLRLTNQRISDVLVQAGIARGQVHVEFVGFVYVPEATTVQAIQNGGSPSGSLTLFVDNKPVGSVGGQRASTDVAKVELKAGEHPVRWVLDGENLGEISLMLTSAADGRPLPVYHTQPLLAALRDGPARTRMILNVGRNR